MYSNLSEEWKLFVPIHKTSDVSTTAYNSSVVTQTIPETNPADSSSFGSRMKEYTVATLNEIAHQVEAQHSADLEELDICDYGMELSCIVIRLWMNSGGSVHPSSRKHLFLTPMKLILGRMITLDRVEPPAAMPCRNGLSSEEIEEPAADLQRI